MSSPVFRRLWRVDQDGIVELSGKLRSVFDGGAHVILGVFRNFWMLEIESCTLSWVSDKIMRTEYEGKICRFIIFSEFLRRTAGND